MIILSQIMIVCYPFQIFRLVAHLNYHVIMTIVYGYSNRKSERKESMMHVKPLSPNLSILNPLTNMTGRTRPSGNILIIYLYQISINYCIAMYQKLVAPIGNGYFWLWMARLLPPMLFHRPKFIICIYLNWVTFLFRKPACAFINLPNFYLQGIHMKDYYLLIEINLQPKMNETRAFANNTVGRYSSTIWSKMRKSTPSIWKTTQR